ncbi:MAG: hypothetical protein RIS70_2644 [Planctomycetota bacterium]
MPDRRLSDTERTAEFVPTDRLLTEQTPLPASPATLDGAETGRQHQADITLAASTHPQACGPTIPGYAIVGEIARGGMGCVYAARDLTLDREVAIKTLLPSANPERFVTEAKITAQLPHPGIPPVYAMGILTDGTPYLSMKYIRGRTLSDELAARPDAKTDLPRFVQVFEQIAQAVGFAHSRGIIHRDLKPLNVMLGEFGEVQVMDWGLAKEWARAAEPDSFHTQPDTSLEDDGHTAVGTVMGTPGYMAPEQARGESVDARADVFALGAILVSILTGRPAFVGTTVRESLNMAAAADLSEVHARLAVCEAESDFILLAKRCLAPDRESRPIDARAVAAEVATYRANVESRLRQAETEKAQARVREAEQRKRRLQLLVAGIAVLLTLSAGLTASLWQMQRAILAEGEAVVNAEQAREERDAKEAARIAEQQRADGERRAKEEAERNLGFARKGNEILGSVFTSLDPNAKYETIAALRNALKMNLTKAIAELDSNSVGDPLDVASMQRTLGASLLGLGEAGQALILLLKAVDTQQSILGQDHPQTIASMGTLAEALRASGQLDKALPLYEQTLRFARDRLGSDHPDTLTSMNNLAVGYHAAGELNKAIPLYRETLDLRIAKFGREHSDTLASMNNLAAAYYALGQVDEAVPLYEQTFERMRSTLGPDHLDTLTSMNNLAAVCFAAGQHDKALPLFERSFELRKTKLGYAHPDTVTTLRNLGIVYAKLNKGDEASRASLEFIELQRKRFPTGDPKFAGVLAQVATDLLGCEQYSTAETLLRECLQIRETTAADEWSTFNTQSQLGGALLGQKKYDEAESFVINGYHGMKAREQTIPAVAAMRIPEAIDRVISLYRARDNADELAKWRAERAKYPAATGKSAATENR